jgi:hypothetical protein
MLIWFGSKSVHLKVSIFAWCSMADPIPTTDNLFRREIANVDSLLCSLDVSVNMLIKCGVKWLNIQGAFSNGAPSHALSFSNFHILIYILFFNKHFVLMEQFPLEDKKNENETFIFLNSMLKPKYIV